MEITTEKLKNIDFYICNPDFIFSNIGLNDIKTKENFIITSSLNLASELWKKNEFQEASNIAWEYMRWNLVKDKNKIDIWKEVFEKMKFAVDCLVNKSPLLSDIANSCSSSLDDFVTKLPFIGASGELLLNYPTLKTEMFFTRQIPIYKQGHWVCGWEGDLPCDNNEFIYPTGIFIYY